VIRSTAQSLLDHVPFGATTTGFGGTFATQENFRIMRSALDELEDELDRSVRLVNYCSGLCMPEIAAMGAFERLDMMLNDALYGILFRDINPVRTLVDQGFSRRINAAAGVVINTGEDNYLTTADAVEEAPAVLASQFINERLALDAGLESWQIGLGHAFEIDPTLEDGLLFEIAQAQMAREIFPDSPLKYMPPTKHMTGNVFRGYQQNALFVLTSVATDQSIHLLGMLTEALHTPLLHDRWLAIDQAKTIRTNARHLSEELLFAPAGRIVRRARAVLASAEKLLERIAGSGLFEALASGVFAATRRPREGGRGYDGVVPRSADYANPFLETWAASARPAGVTR
jgi:beta-lysine 5,6-aminomutase alpha subunit